MKMTILYIFKLNIFIGKLKKQQKLLTRAIQIFFTFIAPLYNLVCILTVASLCR